MGTSDHGFSCLSCGWVLDLIQHQASLDQVCVPLGWALSWVLQLELVNNGLALVLANHAAERIDVVGE